MSHINHIISAGVLGIEIIGKDSISNFKLVIGSDDINQAR